MLQLVVSFLLLAASAVAHCPPGSIYESKFNKCYQFVHETARWFEHAEVYCNSLGGHLAEVESADEGAYIAEIARHYNQYDVFWVGAKKFPDGEWGWTSNASMSHTNWDPGHPDPREACAAAVPTKWVAFPCQFALTFMCTIRPNAKLPEFCLDQSECTSCKPSIFNASSCPDGYTLYSGSCMCYKYYNSSYRSFPEANTACAKHAGGMLAKIPSKDVNDFLTALPGFNTWGSDRPWIGLSCTSDSVSSCTWTDGTPLGNYTNFDNHGAGAYFLLSDISYKSETAGTWVNEDFNVRRAYICQKEPFDSYQLPIQ